MLVHSSVLRVRFPSPLVCKAVDRQFLLTFDPAQSECIWFRPSNVPVVAELCNISDSSGWLRQPTDYVSKETSVRLWACLRVRRFSEQNFLLLVIQDYRRGDLVKGSVPVIVVWMMLSEGISLSERRMLRCM